MENNTERSLCYEPWNSQIRLESRGGRHSSLMFCTNGVLLRKLVGSGRSEDSEEFNALDATHVIVVRFLWASCISDSALVHIIDCFY